MINYIKKSYPNIYIIIVAICITLWFKGVNIIINLFVKKESIEVALLLISISMIILYMDDKSLSELKNIKNLAAVNMTNDRT